VAGKIHRSNYASQYCALRAGLEPFTALEGDRGDSDYQLWAKRMIVVPDR
jgi:hypothetical protein